MSSANYQPQNPATASNQAQSQSLASLAAALLGMLLLLPASIFIATLVLRIFFLTPALYYKLAPSFLGSPFDLRTGLAGTLHQAVAPIIVYSLLFAIFFNAAHRCRRWLNTAIALQSGMLLFLLLIYIIIQHLRYC